MLVQAKFQGPPTTRDGARLYQRALETKRLAEVAETELRTRDNSQLDSNSDADAVVSGFSPVANVEIGYGNALVSGRKEVVFRQPTWEWTPDGKVTALAGDLSKDGSTMTGVFESAGAFTFEVGKQVDANEETYTLNSGTALKVHIFAGQVTEYGDLTARFDKKTGALFVEQNEGKDYRPLYVPYGGEKAARSYGPQGPTKLEQNAGYLVDRDRLQAAENSLTALKSLDNSEADLNPEPGIVVTATFGEAQEEAHLHYSVESGIIHQAAIGMGVEERLAFTRDSDGASKFRLDDHHGIVDYEKAADGSLTVRENHRAFPDDIQRFEEQKAAQAEYQALPWYRKAFQHEPYVREVRLY